MKKWWRNVRRRILPPVAYALARVLGSTADADLANLETPDPGGSCQPDVAG